MSFKNVLESLWGVHCAVMVFSLFSQIFLVFVLWYKRQIFILYLFAWTENINKQNEITRFALGSRSGLAQPRSLAASSIHGIAGINPISASIFISSLLAFTWAWFVVTHMWFSALPDIYIFWLTKHKQTKHAVSSTHSDYFYRTGFVNKPCLCLKNLRQKCISFLHATLLELEWKAPLKGNFLLSCLDWLL